MIAMTTSSSMSVNPRRPAGPEARGDEVHGLPPGTRPDYRCRNMLKTSSPMQWSTGRPEDGTNDERISNGRRQGPRRDGGGVSPETTRSHPASRMLGRARNSKIYATTLLTVHAILRKSSSDLRRRSPGYAMSPNVHIGLIFDYDTGYCRGVLRGIKQYAEAMPHWVLVPVVADSRAVRALGGLNVDGLISWLFRDSVAAQVRKLERPWISVCGVVPDEAVPRVGP